MEPTTSQHCMALLSKIAEFPCNNVPPLYWISANLRCVLNPEFQSVMFHDEPCTGPLKMEDAGLFSFPVGWIVLTRLILLNA